MRKLYDILFFLLIFTTHQLASAQEINGTYAVKNVKTGMYLRVKDANNKNGTPLVLYHPENWKCMTWDFKHIEGNTYQLQNLLTNKTFQAKSAPGSGISLEEQPYKTGDAIQQYQFETVSKDIFMIRLKGTDLYITPSDKEGSTNSQIILAKKTNDKLQYWSIYQQSPTM
ncbi:RICIN domain-containing protein [Pedobacter sp. L105]|uniref:RICIN domain-containing protein n=1 Tax=Pedobacter sp. L105 TaxID=1641871 RepID=UPI00131D8AA9|nr:RICIN domain-containing protein [Pedobacter sp. L105]